MKTWIQAKELLKNKKMIRRPNWMEGSYWKLGVDQSIESHLGAKANVHLAQLEANDWEEYKDKVINPVEDFLQTKITFEFEGEDGTSIVVMRDGEKIGRVWSQLGKEEHDTSYPHNRTEYCLNSVQICGFDRISAIWGCGPFQGKKDCVIHFIPGENKYYKQKKIDYKNYVNNFLNKVNNKADVSAMQSFDAWVVHNI